MSCDQEPTPGSLAEDACEIEIDILREPVGKQDQYVAAHGGICAYTFERDGSVEVRPLELSERTLSGLHNNTLLFYNGSTGGGASGALGLDGSFTSLKAIGFAAGWDHLVAGP